MSSEQRKLTVIMFTDMVGYSKKFSEDEDRAMRLLQEHNGILDAQVESSGGSLIKTAGDSYMVGFDSVNNAVSCAVEIQRDLDRRNAATGVEPIEVRIGIHVGDVFFRDNDVFGDGVNVASRVMSRAEERQIYLTLDVMSIAYGKSDLLYKDLGAFDLKNIDRPIQVYEVLWDPARAGEATRNMRLGAAPARNRGKRLAFTAVGGLLAVAVVAYLTLASGGGLAAGETLRLAVLEFEAETDDERLRRVEIDKILTNAVVTKFSQFKPVQIISPRRVNASHAELGEGAATDFSVAEKIAGDVDGRLVIGGKLTQLDDQLIVMARLWDMEREEENLDNFHLIVDSPEALLSVVVDSLSLKFQKRLVEVFGLDIGAVHNVLPIGDLTTHSIEAYGRMIKGHELYHSGDIDAGVLEIVVAAEIDPDFALAYSLIACAYSFAKEDSLSGVYAEKARSFSDRFKGISLEALIFRGNMAWFEYYGAADDAGRQEALKRCERSYRTITELYPDDYQGYLYLGLYHSYLANDDATAIPLYEKAIELNPRWFPTYRDLALSTLRVADKQAALAILDGFVADYPDAPGVSSVPDARKLVEAGG